MSNITQTNDWSTRKLFTIDEVGGMFGVSSKTVRRLIQRGLLKRSVAIRHIRIPKESVEAFVAKTSTN